MGTLGILTCQILEREFAFLLARDPDVSGITVVEDAFSQGLLQELKSAAGNRLRTVPLVRDFTPPEEDGRLEILVRVLELSLHDRKHILQNALIKATREMARPTDAILLGYGLCGNALENPRELLGDAGVPLFIPMDEDHPVDDCVGLLIGGRENYYEEQCREAGTFFMIPGWTRHWRQIFEREYGAVSDEMARRIFRHYKRSLLIPTPAARVDEMKAGIEDFNDRFGFRVEVRAGTLRLLEKAWEEAKACVTGEPG